MQTLAEAQIYVEEGLEEGVTCPCCGQHAKKYRRTLNKAMIQFLDWLVTAYLQQSGGWLHVNDGPIIQNRRGGGDFAKLQHWGMIVEKPREPGDTHKGKTSGFWAPTEYGVEFQQGKRQAWKYIYLFNNQVYGHEGPAVNIAEVRQVEFDYGTV